MNYQHRRGLYLFLINRLRLPRGVTAAITKSLAFATEPGVAGQRRSAASGLLASRGTMVPDAAGHRVLPPGELPGTQAVVAACRKIFERVRASGTLDGRVEDASKRFLVPVV